MIDIYAPGYFRYRYNEIKIVRKIYGYMKNVHIEINIDKYVDR